MPLMTDHQDVYRFVDYAGKLFPQLWLHPHICISGNGGVRHGRWVRGHECQGSFSTLLTSSSTEFSCTFIRFWA